MQISYRNIKLPKLDVTDGLVKIEIPSKYKKMNNEDIIGLLIENMYSRIANEQIEYYIEKARILLKLAPEDYEIKRMDNILAKCLDKNKIIINPDIVMQRKDVIEYIIFHEFCHLRYKTHVKGFYELLKKYVPKYKIYEEELKKLYM